MEVKTVDVREFIEAIRKSRDMSFNAFSDTLEYKSKTSLSRLMRGESNLRSMESFCQRVKEHIDLTNEERRALTDCTQRLQRNRTGDGSLPAHGYDGRDRYKFGGQ